MAWWGCVEGRGVGKSGCRRRWGEVQAGEQGESSGCQGELGSNYGLTFLEEGIPHPLVHGTQSPSSPGRKGWELGMAWMMHPASAWSDEVNSGKL